MRRLELAFNCFFQALSQLTNQGRAYLEGTYISHFSGRLSVSIVNEVIVFRLLVFHAYEPYEMSRVLCFYEKFRKISSVPFTTKNPSLIDLR